MPPFPKIGLRDSKGNTVAAPHVKGTLDDLGGPIGTAEVRGSMSFHKPSVDAAMLKAAHLALFRIAGYRWPLSRAGQFTAAPLRNLFRSGGRREDVEAIFGGFASAFHVILTDGLPFGPPVGGGVLFFETYPSAFVRLNYPSFSGYKTLKEAKESDEPAQDQPAERQARHDLLDAIGANYSIDTTHCASALETACATSASDAFDGFLSAIAAWDYLKWRFQQASTVRMSSPAELLGVQRAEDEKTRIKKEGWFLVRLPMGLLCSHDESDQKCADDGRGPSGENRQGEE
jgi:hypothetical protein